MSSYKIMKIVMVIMLLPMWANGQELVKRANDAYNKDKYGEALELYLKAEKEYGSSSDLYYNIGNTYYKIGNIGRSILYYERSLILNPQNEEARENLDFVNDKVQSKAERGSSYISESLDTMISMHTSNGWATTAAMLFIVFIGLVVVYVFADKIIIRKVGFFGGGVVLLGSIITLIFAFRVQTKETAHNQAVVVVPSVTLSTSPREAKDKTEEAFLLSEGNKVTIVDSVENKNGATIEKWYDVKADDSHRAWIKSGQIEII